MRKQDQVVVNLKGGLGNQLFQFAFGVNLAVEKNISITFSSRWFNYQNFRKPLISTLLGIELDSPLQISSEDTRLKIVNSHHSKFSETNEVISQTEMHFNDEYITKKNCIFDGYWQSEKYFSQNSSVVRNFLQEKLQLKKSTERNLIMHARRGDYLNENLSKVHGILDLKYYEKAYNLFGHNSKKNTLITENANELESEFKDFLKSNYFEVISHQTEVDDLRLFSTATIIAIANSTFSWWGAYLSEADVVAPRKWFSEKELRSKNVCDVFPEKWTLL